MTNASPLLPTSAEPYEHGLAIAGTETLPIPFAQLLDPATAPVEWLPFLAVHEGVRLWFADWPETRKRRIIGEWPELAGLIGTRAAAERFLGYVDAEIFDLVSYPARFVFGVSALGITPIDHPPFKARYLIQVSLDRPHNALALGQGALGAAALRRVDLEPIRRVKRALEIAKADESEYLVSFAWRRPMHFADAVTFGDAVSFNHHVARRRL